MGLLSEGTLAIKADVDIEKTFDSFHAYAVPDGVDIRPGDVVYLHGVPTDIGFGERLVMQCDATVHRAGPLLRAWTAFTSMFELTHLYEVGFEPKEAS
ncbi:MAG: hypothetical protein RQ966_16720 [Acetobacteraceae bacterium]|nr:hypothetical protein [Acetobacteraceae bacterium]